MRTLALAVVYGVALGAACSASVDVHGVPKQIALCVDNDAGALGLPPCDAGAGEQ